MIALFLAFLVIPPTGSFRAWAQSSLVDYGPDLQSPLIPVLPAGGGKIAVSGLPHSGLAASEQWDIPVDLRDSLNSGEAGGWRASGSSLLLYDGDGSLINELGLGSWREPRDLGFEAVRRLKGGLSEDGRFAWHWQKVETVSPGQNDASAMASKALVYLGFDGRLLWKDERADSPESLEPVLLSRNGKVVLVTEKDEAGWGVVALTDDGREIMSLGAAARLGSVFLTGNGRFAAVLWGRAGGPLVYSFLDLRRRVRWDIPASKTTIGRARISEDGAILSGGKTVYHF